MRERAVRKKAVLFINLLAKSRKSRRKFIHMIEILYLNGYPSRKISIFLFDITLHNACACLRDVFRYLKLHV